jgi:SpoVK/Ycf46/Vps4 family AAA+-type ATPase
VILYGPPTGAKTSMLKAFKTWYEAPDGGRVERFSLLDTTTLSKAGLERWILKKARRKELPEILGLEEIEKFNPDNLLSLLAIMDDRGTLSRLNATEGYQEESAPVLVVATCNDAEAFQQFAKGALWSRFKKRLYCARPNRDLMRKILLREVVQIPGGNSRWADEAMRFAYEVYPKETGKVMADPREIIGLLDGRDRLLDGSCQKDCLAVYMAEKEEQSANN